MSDSVRWFSPRLFNSDAQRLVNLKHVAPKILNAVLQAPFPPFIAVFITSQPQGDTFEAVPYSPSRIIFVNRLHPTDFSYLRASKRHTLSSQLELLDISVESYLGPITLDIRAQRITPMKMLILRGYEWNHSEDECANNWDFTRLEFLRVIGIPLRLFIHTVLSEHLANLRSLQIDCHIQVDRKRMVPDPATFTKLLNSLVNLEELDISGL